MIARLVARFLRAVMDEYRQLDSGQLIDLSHCDTERADRYDERDIIGFGRRPRQYAEREVRLDRR